VFRGSNDPIGAVDGAFRVEGRVPMLLNMLDDYGIKSTFSSRVG